MHSILSTFAAAAVLTASATATAAADTHDVAGTRHVADTHHVAGSGVVVAQGQWFRFTVHARGDGTAARGRMTVLQRTPSGFHKTYLQVDCLNVQGGDAVLSGFTVRERDENGPVSKYPGFRIPLAIRDLGRQDRVVFGHGPPGPAECGHDLLAGFPDFPVKGGFSVR